jgi:delta 1-pyrroline-5-carboxylate dehydrogenase
MDELVGGDPALLATDIGPVIDLEARDSLEAHVAAMAAEGHVRHRVPLPEAYRHGAFVAPTLIEIDRIDQLEREVFGPVLHVVVTRPVRSTPSLTASMQPATASLSASTAASTKPWAGS